MAESILAFRAIPRKAADRTGLQYGRLTVVRLSHTGTGSDRSAYWECLCECGTYIVEDVRNGDVYYECPEEGRRGQAPAEEFAARVARRVPVELLPER